MARSGVRGTFSQSGPSHPTVGVRLARTLCRTKCPSRRQFHVPGGSVVARNTNFGFWLWLSRIYVPFGEAHRGRGEKTEPVSRAATRGYSHTPTGSAQSLPPVGSCKLQVKLQVYAAGVHRASRSETLGRGVHRSGGVPPLLFRQPRRGSFCGAPQGITKTLPRAAHECGITHRSTTGPTTAGRLGPA